MFLLRSSPILQRLLFGALALAMLPALAGAQTQRDRDDDRDRRRASRIDTSFVFDARGTVELRLFSGTIVVTGSGNDRLYVVATSDQGEVRLDGSGSRIALDTERVGGRLGNTRYELRVPRGVRVVGNTHSANMSVRGTGGDVRVESVSGDMVVHEARGRVSVETVSGEIELGTITGNVRAESVSGDVVATGINGEIEVETTSGDITLREIASRFVRSETTSGDLRFQGQPDATGRYEFRSHSGDVTLVLPAETRAELTVATWSGDIESVFPMTLQPGAIGSGGGQSKRYTFSVNGGGARITAETFSGDVTLRRR